MTPSPNLPATPSLATPTLPATPQLQSNGPPGRRVPRPLVPPGQSNLSTPPSTPVLAGTPSVPAPAAFGGQDGRRTVAEAYADAHSQPATGNSGNGANQFSTAGSKEKERKPIFDWITRKLNARRATVSEGPPRIKQPRSRLASMPKARGLVLYNPGGPSAGTRRESNAPRMSRADTHLSVSFSISSAANTLERMGRREANNPYPSLPLGHVGGHRQGMDDATILSTTVGTSVSGDWHSGTGEGDGMESVSRQSSRSRGMDIREKGEDEEEAGGEGKADDDASIRPFPPSVQASPTQSSSRSRSTSLLYPNAAYMRRPATTYSISSEGGTGRDGGSDDESDVGDDDESRRQRRKRAESTSTKLTTCISFDSGSGVGRIAQAPIPQQRQSLSSRQSSPRRLSTPVNDSDPGAQPFTTTPASVERSGQSMAQAPKHTAPHPGYNPRPSSPPDPNASTLTLASSTFAFTHAAQAGRINRPQSLATSPSVITWADPATPMSPPPGPAADRECEYPASTYTAHSHTFSFTGTGGGHLSIGAPSVITSVRGVRGGGGPDGRADKDASVRAVRRKGSWESYESGWSWRGVGSGGIGTMSTPIGGASSTAGVAGPERALGEGTELERVPESPSFIAVV